MHRKVYRDSTHSQCTRSQGNSTRLDRLGGRAGQGTHSPPMFPEGVRPRPPIRPAPRSLGAPRGWGATHNHQRGKQGPGKAWATGIGWVAYGNAHRNLQCRKCCQTPHPLPPPNTSVPDNVTIQVRHDHDVEAGWVSSHLPRSPKRTHTAPRHLLQTLLLSAVVVTCNTPPPPTHPPSTQRCR